jgi:hypothetical protein
LPTASSASLAGIDSAPELAVLIILGIYAAAAVFNLYIPKLAIDRRLPSRHPLFVLKDFWHSFSPLWRDPLGQVSLAVTTLFSGASATLCLIVLSWAALVLGYDFESATQLTAAVQNFNENLSILVMLGAYAVMIRAALDVQTVLIAFGPFIVAIMYVICRAHRHDGVHRIRSPRSFAVGA